MIPRNIDLTLDLAFRSRNTDDFTIAEDDGRDIDDDTFLEWSSAIEGANVSISTYNKLSRIERFFGRFTGGNAKHRIFNKSYVYDDNNKCYRCGKEIRIPWSGTGHLCQECNEILESEYGKRPWDTSFDIDVPTNFTGNRGPMEIFDMK